MARRLWPKQDPIGQRIVNGDNPPFTVIGVVGDVRYGSLEAPKMMQYYQLIPANPELYVDQFVVRTAGDPELLVPALQKAIWELDSSEPVTHVQTMDHLLNSVTLDRRFETWLLSAFAGMALFLSALGLFGVASLSAERRIREFGIRLAIGASGSQIVRLELGRSMIVAAVGLLAGLLLSIAFARAIAGLLYRVSPWNAEAFALVAVVLIASSVLAGWIPATRAARIDPVTVLREE
jgi:predicted lysophospholipase L1 biosynthesis ABC-type transport system permease subunit